VLTLELSAAVAAESEPETRLDGGAREYEAAQRLAGRVEISRDNGAGDEQVAASLGLVDENSSASSALVCLPARESSTRCASRPGLSLGCLPRSRLLALATFMPSLVLNLIKSDSNSAIIPRTLNSSRPTGSVGSRTEPPILRFTPGAISALRSAVRSGVSVVQLAYPTSIMATG